MQVLDMRALRSIFANKHLLNSNTQSLSPPRSCITFCKYSGNPSSSRYFRSTPERFIRSTNYRLSKEAADFDGPKGWTSSSSSWSSHSAPKNEKSREVSAIYDPITGRLVTRRVTNHHNDVAKESESSSGNKNFSLSSTDHEDGSRSRVYRNISNDTSSSAISGSKKKRKSKVTWVCSQCGHSDGQWWGICKECKTSGTMTQFSESPGENEKMSGFEASENLLRSWFPQQSAEGPVRLTNVNKGISQINWRIPLFGLFGAEVARVLGGGLVPGSLILVGGDPGVGKSTLLLQIAAIVAEANHMARPAPVVYVSGEESIEQIGDRADRMRIGTNELYVYASTDIEDILEKTQKLSPSLLVVDSIQTVYLLGVNGSAGGISQVKECTSALLRFAKKTNIPVILIGHVTKSGDIAGPRVLEHIVDVVLYMEGEKYSSHRLLRSAKNRYGSTDELGVFEMSQSGLQAVSNPSEMFLREQYSDSEVLAGLAIAVVMDGSRTFVIEIQALCVAGSSVSRQVNGVQTGRAEMIISVLMKQAGLRLQENGIFLNVVSGVTLMETAGDLAVAAAICSSFLEFPIPSDVAFVGEIGLGGELRMVPRMEKRINTIEKLGYKKCIVPKSAEKFIIAEGFGAIEICGCRNLKEMINSVFRIG